MGKSSTTSNSSNSVKETYTFPEHGVSVEAENLEEAIKLVSKEKK